MRADDTSCRVLVADRHRDGADSLALLLALWGYDVRIASSGPDALLLARAFRPHVAVVELRLDGLDGYTVARRLRDEWGCTLPLVALTGYGDTAHRRAAAAGFQVYLVKAVEPERVRRVVERLTGSALRQRAARAGPSAMA